MKLVILDGNAANPGDLSWEWLKEVADEIEIYDVTPPELVVERAKDADVLTTNKVVFTREVIEQLPKCKYIQVLATGYNVVDCEAAKEHGITVCNIPAYSTDGVAQLVFALTMELANRVGLHSDSVNNGEWAACPQFCYWKTTQVELAGKTFGIVGFGKIGSAVAQIANALKMNVKAYSPHTRSYDGFGKVDFVSLDEVISDSDVISLHCPLTPETTGLVNAEFIAKMKKTAFLINTSRGPVLDEEAVAKALNNGDIAGCGVDVLCAEPPVNGSPLIGAKNCFITPHIAWASLEARTRLMNIFESNFKAFLNGKPENVVNN